MGDKAIFIIGLPGSGKSTLAEALSKIFDMGVISSTLLMEAIPSFYKKELLDKYVNKGTKIPEEIYMDLIENHISNNKNRNWIIDGVPYNFKQLKIAEEILKKQNITLISVIHIDIDEKTIHERIANRRVCPNCKKIYTNKEAFCKICGEETKKRIDDNPEILEKRILEQKGELEEVIDYYENSEKLISLSTKDPKKKKVKMVVSKMNGNNQDGEL